MKTKIVIITAAFFFTTAFASAQILKEKQVPQPVLDYFKKNYPSVDTPNWEKVQEYYEASYSVEGLHYALLVDSIGTQIATKVEIPVVEVPQKIIDYLKKEEAPQKITGTERITKANETIFFQVETNDFVYVFDFQGKLVTKESDREENE